MTKKVRVENADQSNHTVRVRTICTHFDPVILRDVDVKVGETVLEKFGDSCEVYVHSRQYIIIDEV